MTIDISAIRPAPGGTSVGEYARLLRRFWWVVVLGTLGGAIGGVGLVMTSGQSYTSTTTVLVGDVGIASADVANSRTASGELNLDTEAQIVTSGTVGQRAADIVGHEGSVYALRNRVAVRVPPNSGVLLIDFTASDPESAKEGSTAFANAYLENRRASAQEALDRRTERLNASIAELRADLTEASQRAADTRSVQATSEVQQLSDQIRTASAALAAAILQEVDAGAIISQASPPTSAGATSRMLFGVGAGFLGFVVGIGVAFLLDRLRLGRVGLDDLQALPAGTTHVVRPAVPGATGIGHAGARRMWAWLGRLSSGSVDTIAVVAAGEGVGTSARTALVLAQVRAEDGDAVAFTNSSGAAEEALVEDGVFASLPATARSAKLQAVPDSNLLLAEPGRKGHTMLPGHVGGLLRWLTTNADAVVFHASPLPSSEEAVDLAPDVDLVLVVAVLGRTRRRDLDASVAALRTVGVAPVAVVAIRPHRRAGRVLGGTAEQGAAIGHAERRTGVRGGVRPLRKHGEAAESAGGR